MSSNLQQWNRQLLVWKIQVIILQIYLKQWIRINNLGIKDEPYKYKFWNWKQKNLKNRQLRGSKKSLWKYHFALSKNPRVLNALENLNKDGFKLNYDKATELYQQKYDKAFDIAKSLLKTIPKLSSSNLLGGISLALQNYISKLYFKSCISADPNFVHSYNNLGLIHSGFKEYLKAIEYLVHEIRFKFFYVIEI